MNFLRIFFQKFSKNIHFTSNFGWGRYPPDPPVFGWGANAPQTLPINGRLQHLIEAAKRGRLDQMLFFRRR